MHKYMPVLVVDDDTDILMAMKDILESEGHQVLTAKNGKQAFEVLSGDIKPALIFLDIRMPVMNGYEFLKIFKENVIYADIAVVVLSATASANEVELMGANHFLQKPVNIELVLSFAHKYCSKDRE